MALLACWASTSSASAASFHVNPGVVEFVAAAGETNSVTIAQDGQSFTATDATSTFDWDWTTAPPECTKSAIGIGQPLHQNVRNPPIVTRPLARQQEPSR